MSTEGTTPATPATPPATPPSTPEEGKLTITQAELESTIAARVARERQAWEKRQPTGPDPAEVEALRAFKQEQERKELERKGEYDKALAAQKESLEREYAPKLTAAEERAKAIATKLEEKVVGLAISDAAGKANAINPEQVRRLLSRPGEPNGYIKMNDDHEPTVIGADGNPRFVNGQAMTPDQLVKEFLDANPNLVRSTGVAGGGAGGGRSITAGTVSAIQQAEAKVKALEDEALRSGSPRALAAHAAAVKEMQQIRSGAQTH